MPTCQTCGAQVTLLAEVGPNAEGPLPWVEREYTPVSSAKQWELGRCELLVKVYPRGLTVTLTLTLTLTLTPALTLTLTLTANR